ncbi:hypothetical protein BJ508DRAFT_53784 [Ascobolus immersus RN42]|uniref:Uncharacterized protein n=1 Tax=Ascobolus immersus RN42 TaxID=1160509 RepID=A0A3N4HIL8_ASCIM|nr:hypothetical protein BJ508DRAFT_53784 [Ascobolus immersus RN42]
MALQIGIPGFYDGHTKESFTLRAHLGAICGDSKALQKIVGASGAGYAYCMYCKAHGIWGCNYVYCPFTAPRFDANGDPLPDEGMGDSGSFGFPHYDSDNKPLHYNLDPANLFLRTHEQYLAAYDNIIGNIAVAETKKIAGIRDSCILANLKSVSIPESFPIDHMHLWFANLVKMLFDHMRGRYYNKRPRAAPRKKAKVAASNPRAKKAAARKRQTASGTQVIESDPIGVGLPDNRGGEGEDEWVEPDSDYEVSDGEGHASEAVADEEPVPEAPEPSAASATGPGKKPRGKKRKQGSSAAGTTATTADGNKEAAAAKPKKFEDTDDPWNLKEKIFNIIGNDMKQTNQRGHIPTEFGYAPRSISECSHEWKCEEFKSWMLRYFPIYANRRLPDAIYEELLSLVRAISLCDQYTLSPIQLEEIEGRLIRFLEFYEREFYGYREDKISAMRPTFHAIAHVTRFLRLFGPAYVSSCWVIERVCGLLARATHSKRHTNRNMSLNILLDEQLRHFSYTVSEASLPSHATTKLADLSSPEAPLTEQQAALRRKIFSGVNRRQQAPFASFSNWNSFLSSLIVTPKASTASTSASTLSLEQCTPQTLSNREMLIHSNNVRLQLNGKGKEEVISDKVKARLRSTYDEWKNMDSDHWHYLKMKRFGSLSFFVSDEEIDGQCFQRELRISSAKVKESGRTRNSSRVLYCKPLHDGSEGPTVYCGEVEAFFTIVKNEKAIRAAPMDPGIILPFSTADVCGSTRPYAAIQEYKVGRDGKELLFITGDGRYDVTSGDFVRELIGVVCDRQRLYLTRRLNPFFPDLVDDLDLAADDDPQEEDREETDAKLSSSVNYWKPYAGRSKTV